MDVGIEVGFISIVFKGNMYVFGDFFEYWYVLDRIVINEYLVFVNVIVNGNVNVINLLKFD